MDGIAGLRSRIAQCGESRGIRRGALPAVQLEVRLAVEGVALAKAARRRAPDVDGELPRSVRHRVALDAHAAGVARGDAGRRFGERSRSGRVPCRQSQLAHTHGVCGADQPCALRDDAEFTTADRAGEHGRAWAEPREPACSEPDAEHRPQQTRLHDEIARPPGIARPFAPGSAQSRPRVRLLHLVQSPVEPRDSGQVSRRSGGLALGAQLDRLVHCGEIAQSAADRARRVGERTRARGEEEGTRLGIRRLGARDGGDLFGCASEERGDAVEVLAEAIEAVGCRAQRGRVDRDDATAADLEIAHHPSPTVGCCHRARSSSSSPSAVRRTLSTSPRRSARPERKSRAAAHSHAVSWTSRSTSPIALPNARRASGSNPPPVADPVHRVSIAREWPPRRTERRVPRCLGRTRRLASHGEERPLRPRRAGRPPP